MNCEPRKMKVRNPPNVKNAAMFDATSTRIPPVDGGAVGRVDEQHQATGQRECSCKVEPVVGLAVAGVAIQEGSRSEDQHDAERDVKQKHPAPARAVGD